MRLPNNNPTSAPGVTELPEGVAGSSHQRMVRVLLPGKVKTKQVEETYDSEEIAYCKCGEQINIVRGSDRTWLKDKTRLRYPDDTEGWCVFRCRRCGEVADPKPKHPND
jgi:hypothetical protein